MTTPPADLFRLPRNDPLALVDDAVESWASHQIAAPLKLGYGESDGSCRNAVSSETWDSATEILERRVDAMVIDAVDGAMPSLSGQQRAIVWAVYANRIGPAVWRSQWLGGLQHSKLVALHRGALATLRPLLRQRGLVV